MTRSQSSSSTFLLLAICVASRKHSIFGHCPTYVCPPIGRFSFTATKNTRSSLYRRCIIPDTCSLCLVVLSVPSDRVDVCNLYVRSTFRSLSLCVNLLCRNYSESPHKQSDSVLRYLTRNTVIQIAQMLHSITH